MSLSRPTARFQAVGGLALAALFLVAQASTFTHRLFVQHVVCAEHGELVHAEPPEVAAAGVERELRAIPEVPNDHGHDHCLVTLPRREELRAQPPLDPLIVCRPALPIDALDRAASALPGPKLLLLAPKSSPPA